MREFFVRYTKNRPTVQFITDTPDNSSNTSPGRMGGHEGYPSR